MTKLRSIYYGHYVVLASFLLHFTALGIVYSAGLYVVPLERVFSSGRGAVGWIPSLFVGMMVMLSYPAGIIFDGFIKRNRSVKVLFALGGVISGVGLICASYGDELWLVIVSAFVTGVGLGLFGTTATSCVQPWYDKKRGLATGLAMSGSGLGNFIYAIAIQGVMNRHNDEGCEEKESTVNDDSCKGWRTAMRWEGIISLLLVLFASVIIRVPRDGEIEGSSPEREVAPTSRLGLAILSTHWSSFLRKMPSHPKDSESGRNVTQDVQRKLDGRDSATPLQQTPEESIGDSTNPECGTNSQLEMGGDEDDVTSGSPTSDLPQISLVEVLRTRAFATLLLFKFTFAFAYLNFFGHISAFAVDAGISSDTAAIALSSIGISSLAGRLCLGYLADKFGKVLMLRGSMFVLMIAAGAWQFCDTVPSLFAVCIIYGFNAGGYPSLPPSIVADYYGKLSPRNLFQMVGLSFTVETPGVLGGIPLVGLMFDKYGSYRAGSIFTASVMLLGNILLWSMPSQQSQHRDIERRCSTRTAATILDDRSTKRQSLYGYMFERRRSLR